MGSPRWSRGSCHRSKAAPIKAATGQTFARFAVENCMTLWLARKAIDGIMSLSDNQWIPFLLTADLQSAGQRDYKSAGAI
jgi:hypothetical protein